MMDDAREELTSVIAACKARISKLPEGHDRGLADAIVDGLDRRGLVIAELADVIDPPDEHLRMLKLIRGKIRAAVDDEEKTPARDLASLTRRLQDVSREISGIEERLRADSKSKKGTRTNGTTTRPKASAKSGSLKI